jgi:glycine/D-amino acid oxidase-like deaminating enzyme
MTPDNLPIIDKISGYGGLYIASGFNGGGFHISPWVGKQMSEFIMKGARPTELLPFNAERFVAGLN